MANLDMEQRVDRTLSYLQNISKDPFTNAVKWGEAQGLEPQSFDYHANLIKGAGHLLEIVENVSDDEDFLAVAKVKILAALYIKLGFLDEKQIFPKLSK